MIYDIILVGSGIASLYCAYLLKELNPKIKILLLEKDKRVGGRILNTNFHGVNIPLGAGVGRADKDYLLVDLIKRLEMKDLVHQGRNEHQYAKTIHKEPSFTIYNKVKKGRISMFQRMKFESFGKQMMGSKNYKDFVEAVGYSDFEKMDHVDVIKHYGMEDNIDPINILYIPWKVLIDRLIHKIGANRIRYSQEVISIKDTADGLTVYTQNKIYKCKELICGGTITTMRKLFPRNKIYKDIMGQPFLRIYIKCSDFHKDIMREKIPATYIVGSPLQKIIPINHDKGVYMIAYSDNDSAKLLYRYVKNNTIQSYLENKISKLLNHEIKIDALKHHYWSIGTHYYKPLSKEYKSREEFIEKAQRPRDKIFVIGEVVALEQGWCEGALQSVHEILY